jgi:hypothetical protein
MDTFSQANVAPDVGAELMDALGINSLDIQTPDVYHRFTDIAKYLSRFSDAPAIARMVSHGTPTKEKLAKMYEYVGLRKQLDVIREEMKKLPSTDTITGEAPEIRTRREELQMNEYRVIEEIKRYE